MSDVIEVDAIVAEAKTGFNLKDRLQKRSLRTARQTVYTDEVLGQKYIELSQVLNAQLSLIARPVDGKVFTEAVRDEAQEVVDKLQPEVDEVLAKLKAGGLTFDLQAVPEVIVKDCRRKARKHLGAKGAVPAEQTDAYNDAYVAEIIAATVIGYTAHETGEHFGKLEYDEALALVDFLPMYEFQKLDSAIKNIQFTNAISESVVDDADF